MAMIDHIAPFRAGIGNAIDQLGRALDMRTEQRRTRRHVANLLDLDDRMLEDIGVTRSEIRSVSSLPPSVDAATELRRVSLARRSPM